MVTTKLTLKVSTSVKKELQQKQAVQKFYFDRFAKKLPSLGVDDRVLLKNGSTVETVKVT